MKKSNPISLLLFRTRVMRLHLYTRIKRVAPISLDGADNVLTIAPSDANLSDHSLLNPIQKSLINLTYCVFRSLDATSVASYARNGRLVLNNECSHTVFAGVRRSVLRIVES